MKITFYAFVLILLAVSCNSDDDTQHNNRPMLNGSWSLVNVSGGFAGVNDDFEMGIITWDFNPINLKLTVTNTNTTNVIYDGFPTGTYDYEELSSVGENDSLIVNTLSYEITILSSSQLVLDEGVAADGFLLTFSK